MYKNLVQRYIKVSLGQEVISTTYYLEIDNWDLMELFTYCAKVSLAKAVIREKHPKENTRYKESFGFGLSDEMSWRFGSVSTISSIVLSDGIKSLITPIERMFMSYGKIYVSRFLDVRSGISDLKYLKTVIIIKNEINFPER
jgi:hypothetical protein